MARLLTLFLLFGLPLSPARAAFSSLYGFGDGACSSTDNIDGGSAYYPYTYSNGRIWIQVLAQRLGVPYDANKNLSYFDHTSTIVVSEDLPVFSAADAGSALFVVWVCDADFADYLINFYPTYGLDPTRWNSAINTSLANHQALIQTLYNKGARTLVMPNAVDISRIPQYSGMSTSDKNIIRQGVATFNASFAAIISQAKTSLPGIKIHTPDFFALHEDILSAPASYGLVNPGIAATQNAALYPLSLTGPGAYYVFWDPWDPSAKAHEIMADKCKQIMAPVKIGGASWANGNVRLTITNVPVGLAGFVEAKTNLASGTWSTVATVSSTNATQTVSFLGSGPRQFYRLRFPLTWTWP